MLRGVPGRPSPSGLFRDWRTRVIFVLGRIDEILMSEKANEQERDVRFVELEESLCDVRPKQFWRIEKLISFDDVLQNRFPESRRKAYYLMAIHKNSTRIPKQQLREAGWSKVVELVKVVRKEKGRVRLCNLVAQRQGMQKEEFSAAERHLTGKDLNLGTLFIKKLQTRRASNHAYLRPRIRGPHLHLCRLPIRPGVIRD